MKIYYIFDKNEQLGPYDINELQLLKITKNTPVWTEGFTDWLPAGEIEELKGLFDRTTPPPFIPPNVIQSIEVVDDILVEESSTPNIRSKKGPLIFIGIIILAILTYLAASTYISNRDHIKEYTKTKVRNDVFSYLKVRTQNYLENGEGHVSGVPIILQNECEFKFELVKVRVMYHKRNGSLLAVKYLNFNYVQPFQQRILGAPEADKGIQLTLDIVGVKSNELGL